MGRKIDEPLPLMNTWSSFVEKERNEIDSDSPSSSFSFPSFPQSPFHDHSKRNQTGVNRSFDTCDALKPPPKRTLRHVRSAITTNDISEPIPIEKKDFSIDVPFPASLQRNVMNSLSTPQSPSFFNFHQNIQEKQDEKCVQEAHYTKTKLHQRGRTDPSISTSTIKARNVLVPKRWSALFSSKVTANLQINNAPQTTLNAHAKKLGKANSPKFEDPWYSRVSQEPREISFPISVSASPGSALSKAIVSSGNYISMSPASLNPSSNPSCHDAERMQFKLDPNNRAYAFHSLNSQLQDKTCFNSPNDRRNHSMPMPRINPFPSSASNARSSGRYTDFHEPIEDVLEEYLLQDEEEKENGGELQDHDLRDLSMEEYPRYRTPRETSMLCESQSYTAWPTHIEGRTMSERNASTPVLMQELDRSLSSSELMERSFTQENFSLSFHSSPDQIRMRECRPETHLSIRPDESISQEWGSRPEGVCVGIEDEISTKLKEMLMDQKDRIHQKKTVGWIDRPRSGTYREAALKTLLSQQKYMHETSIDEDIQSALQSNRAPDASHLKEHMPMNTDLQRYLRASRCDPTKSLSQKKKPEHDKSSENPDDDCASTYLDSTMDATSILENDSDSVEIRTAWRGKVEQYMNFNNGRCLRNDIQSSESFDMSKRGENIIGSDSSYSPVLRPSNIPRRKHPRKPSLLELNEAEENQNYAGEIVQPRQITKNPNRGVICIMGMQDTLQSDTSYEQSLPPTTSEGTMPDDSGNVDSYSHCVQREKGKGKYKYYH